MHRTAVIVLPMSDTIRIVHGPSLASDITQRLRRRLQLPIALARAYLALPYLRSTAMLRMKTACRPTASIQSVSSGGITHTRDTQRQPNAERRQCAFGVYTSTVLVAHKDCRAENVRGKRGMKLRDYIESEKGRKGRGTETWRL
jgi:hypothetical protein